jgi:hypothetical protein
VDIENNAFQAYQLTPFLSFWLPRIIKSFYIAGLHTCSNTKSYGAT